MNLAGKVLDGRVLPEKGAKKKGTDFAITL